ncbi:MAG: hypothetical protein ACRDRX_21405 [Pseudonocardiaceae bacterium]
MPPAERAPLTLDQLIEQLAQLRARYPEQGPRPVHLLDTDDNGDGLVTDVDPVVLARPLGAGAC